jgi:siroheme synthase-like protein
MPLPVLLRLGDMPVLVVGLGAVGRRRALRLVEAGARVLVVDPANLRAPDGVEHRREPYRAEHLDGRRLAFAAASPEVNRAVAADARARGVWVNVASDPGRSDFHLPATWTDGPVTLAVATSGSPALSRTLRDRAAAALGPEAAVLASVLAALRPEVRARVADPARRAALLRDWADPRWLDHVREHGASATAAALRAMLG